MLWVARGCLRIDVIVCHDVCVQYSNVVIVNNVVNL